MKNLKKIFSIVLSVMILFLFAACNGNTPPTQSSATTKATQAESTAKTGEVKKGGTLVISYMKDMASALYTKQVGPAEYINDMCIYETLMRTDPTGTAQPYLIESLDYDYDNLLYKMKVKKGIKFHDGTTMDAEDVAFSLNLYKATGRKSSSFCSKWDRAEVTGDMEVTLYLTEPDMTLPATLCRDVGAVTSKEAYEKYGEDYLNEHPVGTGPFKLVSWERDVKIKYEKFSDYWKGEPYLDGIELVFISDSLVTEASLKNGDIDAAYIIDFALLDKLAKDGFVASTGSVMTQLPFLAFDSVTPENKNNPCANILVRQAICHAIDQQLICDEIFYGYFKPINQFCSVGPESPYYNDDINGYEYNIEKAKSLLAQAGYPNGFKTYISVKNEQAPLDAATAIQGMLLEIGIDAELRVIEEGDYGVGMTYWDTGMFLHFASVSADVLQQMASQWVQGLSGVVYGLNSIVKPDSLHNTIMNGIAAPNIEGAYQAAKDANKMIIDEYCLGIPLGLGPNSIVLGKHVKGGDWGLVDCYAESLWNCYMDK